MIKLWLLNYVLNEDIVTFKLINELFNRTIKEWDVFLPFIFLVFKLAKN